MRSRLNGKRERRNANIQDLRTRRAADGDVRSPAEFQRHVAVMSNEQIGGRATRKQRPLWQLPLVTALVFVAAILVLYPSPPG